VKIYVVDACVAIKWFVPEIHKEAARQLRNPSYQCTQLVFDGIWQYRLQKVATQRD
jgi:predicted nucleic acid-binding protein